MEAGFKANLVYIECSGQPGDVVRLFQNKNKNVLFARCGMEAPVCNPSSQETEAREGDPYKFKTGLGYIVNSRSTLAAE